MPSPTLNIGFAVGPKTLIANTGKYGIMAAGAGVSAVVTPPAGSIKWHPGDYGASNAFTSIGNGQLSQKQAEIAIIRSGPALGWQHMCYWNSFTNTSQNVYDFSYFDRDYVQCTTGSTTWNPGDAFPGYNNPKRIGLYVWQANFFNTDPTTCIPNYILSNSTYGPAPSGSLHGWWVGDGGTQAEAALWRSSVMTRYIADLTAFANHVLPDGTTVDTSPYVEAIWTTNETVAVPNNTGGVQDDATFTDSGYNTQLQRLNAAMQTAFSHTNVVSANNWSSNAATCYAFELTFPSTRTATGGPDVGGFSFGQNVTASTPFTTYAQCAYVGLKPPGTGGYLDPWIAGGTDLRGIVPYIANIQGSEMGYEQQTNPTDLGEQCDVWLKATHRWWTILVANEAAYVPGNWYGSAYANPGTWNAATSGGVLAEIVNNPVSHTAYPTGYP